MKIFHRIKNVKEIKIRFITEWSSTHLRATEGSQRQWYCKSFGKILQPDANCQIKSFFEGSSWTFAYRPKPDTNCQTFGDTVNKLIKALNKQEILLVDSYGHNLKIKFGKVIESSKFM